MFVYMLQVVIDNILLIQFSIVMVKSKVN